jgi:hypothetical protein
MSSTEIIRLVTIMMWPMDHLQEQEDRYLLRSIISDPAVSVRTKNVVKINLTA